MLYRRCAGATGTDDVTFEYKCVAGPTIVAVKSAKARDQAVKAFEDIMNREAAEGWEFVGIDEFHVSEPQGLFTRKRVYVPSKILVFRRSRTPEPAAAARPAEPAAQPAPPATAAEAAAGAAADARPSIKAIADKLTAAKADKI